LRHLAIGPELASVAHSTGLFGHPIRTWSSPNQDCKLAAVRSGEHAIRHGPVPQSRDALLNRSSHGFCYVKPGQESARVRSFPGRWGAFLRPNRTRHAHQDNCDHPTCHIILPGAGTPSACLNACTPHGAYVAAPQATPECSTSHYRYRRCASPANSPQS
jgi:hypothetical protein